jgi:hypothetical protein
MEAAREFNENPRPYREVRFSRRFLLIAVALVIVGAVFGGTIGSSRKFSSLTSTGSVNSYRLSDEIEKDYNEAISTITGNYSGDIDYEKATQAAIQGMLTTLDPIRRTSHSASLRN